jgi:hypothetical protein
MLPWASPIEGCIHLMATVLCPHPPRTRYAMVGARAPGVGSA